MKTLRTSLLTLSLAAASLGGLACAGGPPTEEEALVGEASSALTVAEESGDVTADAVGAESATELAASAYESAALPAVPGDADGVCDLEARRARIMARYDANGDGRLGPAERQQLKDDLQARGGGFAFRFGVLHRLHALKRLRWVFDTNHDGALSTDERVAMRDALEARCERLRANVLARFDANGNGTLEDPEKQAAKDALRARLQALRAQVLSRYDANGDGALDDTERAQLRADRVAAFQARKAEVVAQFDADHDGTLSDAEKTALKNAIIERIMNGQDAE